MFEFASYYYFHKKRIKIEKVTTCTVASKKRKKEKKNLTGFLKKTRIRRGFMKPAVSLFVFVALSSISYLCGVWKMRDLKNNRFTFRENKSVSCVLSLTVLNKTKKKIAFWRVEINDTGCQTTDRQTWEKTKSKLYSIDKLYFWRGLSSWRPPSKIIKFSCCKNNGIFTSI